MQQDWKQFERLVAAIHHAEMQGGEVCWNEKINNRQFDVVIRFKYGMHDYLTVIECKKLKGKVSVDKIESFATKAKDINANKSIFVTSNGYQKGCIDVARRHGIILLTLNEKVDVTVKQLSCELTPAVNIYDVYLIIDNNLRYELDDFPSGRLQYLMRNIKIKSNNFKATLDSVIMDWQSTKYCSFLKEENKSSISFNPGTCIEIPYDGLHAIFSMNFKYKMIDVAISDEPFLDNHIIESLSTKYELIDESGNVKCATNLSRLSLGHQDDVQKGYFYFLPSISCHYYCYGIDEVYVYFTLVESYQHGQLVRARLKIYKKDSSRYIKVTDSKTIFRLQLLLDDYNHLDRIGNTGE